MSKDCCIGFDDDLDEFYKYRRSLGKLNIDPFESIVFEDSLGAYVHANGSYPIRKYFLRLPKDENFTVVEKETQSGTTTTISYKNEEVIEISSQQQRYGLPAYSYHVNEENIKKLEQTEQLPKPDPTVQKNVAECYKLQQYKTLVREFNTVLFNYQKKLRGDLKKYRNWGATPFEFDEFKEPGAKNSLDHLAWHKLKIITDAQQALSDKSRDAFANIEACLAVLQKPENVNILKQRRDSWLVSSAKIALSLGTILIYRYLMGDQVTQGIRNFNMFEKKNKKMNDALGKPAPVLRNKIYENFCDNVEKMCEGLINYEGLSSHIIKIYRDSILCDFVLFMYGSKIADAIFNAFKPAAIKSETKQLGHGKVSKVSKVEFRVRDLEPYNPIFSEEGLKAAHGRIFDNLSEQVINETGRLGQYLVKVSVSTGKSSDEIRAIIQSKISELRDEFNSRETYPEKNQILLQLRKLYSTTRDPEKLSRLVTENASVQPGFR
jgi:hypothetical protein